MPELICQVPASRLLTVPPLPLSPLPQDGAIHEASRRVSQLKVLAVLGAAPWPLPLPPTTEEVSKEGEGEGGLAATQGAAEQQRGLPEGWRVGETWGLGQQATLAEFEDHVGVDFAGRSIRLGGLGG